MSATRIDPAGARVTATWMARLSPGLQRTGYAGPATRAPDHAGFTRECMRRAPDSPSVAAPSASASDTSASSLTGGLVKGSQPTLRSVLRSVCANGSGNSSIFSMVVSSYDQLPSSLMVMVTS